MILRTWAIAADVELRSIVLGMLRRIRWLKRFAQIDVDVRKPLSSPRYAVIGRCHLDVI